MENNTELPIGRTADVNSNALCILVLYFPRQILCVKTCNQLTPQLTRFNVDSLRCQPKLNIPFIPSRCVLPNIYLFILHTASAAVVGQIICLIFMATDIHFAPSHMQTQIYKKKKRESRRFLETDGKKIVKFFFEMAKIVQPLTAFLMSRI